jgi:uncharacterized protein YndB with AHSA1/START domain
MTNVATETRSIVVERDMTHPPEKIWRALTQSALIEEWLMKNDFQPIVGHKFNFRAQPVMGWNGVTDCEVLELVPHQRLVYTWNASGEQARDGLKTIVTWTLTPHNGGNPCSHGAIGVQAARRRRLSRNGWRLAAHPGKA